MSEPEPLPQGVRLVHIGPHKTGTTAVQFALHNAREALLERGVTYAGKTSQAYVPALGLTGRRGRIGGPIGTAEDWQSFVREVDAAGDNRVVISSESFCHATAQDIERLASDLGPQRVHIVRMVRRYDRLLPSQWQQKISDGGRRQYANYANATATNPDHVFWQRHGFGNLTRLWAEVVGQENMTVVVVNENDRDWLLRVFETFLDLPAGLLKPDDSRANRSLTSGEVEMVRRLNEIRVRRGWVDRVHYAYVRQGISPALRKLPADPEGGRIDLPEGLHEVMVEATQRHLEELRATGVRVVGEDEWLAMSDPKPHAAAREPSVSLATAVSATVSVINQKTRFDIADPDAESSSSADPTLDPPDRSPAALRSQGETPSTARGRWTHVRVLGGDEVADQWLESSMVPVPQAKETSRNRGLSFGTLSSEAPRSKRVLTVLAFSPPTDQLLKSWQEHLLARGTMDLPTWLAAQAPDVAGRAKTLLSQTSGVKRVACALNVSAPTPFLKQIAVLTRKEPASLQPASSDAGPLRSTLSYAELCWLHALNCEQLTEQQFDRYVRRGAYWWLAQAALPREWMQAIPGEVHDWAQTTSTEIARSADSAGVAWLRGAEALAPHPVMEPEAVPRLASGVCSLGVSGAIAMADPSHGDFEG